MAEKYGTAPPRWTKAWWGYFWDYYKWHVIITAAAVLIVAFTIGQCATRAKYDMAVVYAGHMNYSRTETDKLRKIVADNISDIDGNGEISVLFQSLVFADSAGAEEYDYAIQTKLDVSFMEDDTFIYLFDEEQAQSQLRKDAADQIFIPLDFLAEDTNLKTLTAEDGTPYAVSLEESGILKENNIYCDDLYIMIRQNYGDSDESVTAHENSIDAARALVKYGKEDQRGDSQT